MPAVLRRLWPRLLSPGLTHAQFSKRKRDGRVLHGVAVWGKGLMSLDVSVLWSRVWCLAELPPSSALLPGDSRFPCLSQSGPS